MVWNTFLLKRNIHQRFVHSVEKYIATVEVCPIKKKAMNADLVGAFNILHNAESPQGDRRNGSKTAPLSSLPALTGILAL